MFSALLLLLLLLIPGADAADSFGGYSFYIGDIHAHSGVSGDGGADDLSGTCLGDCGNFEDLFQTARDNGLDFAAVADHVNGLRVPATSAAYDDLIDLTLAEDDPSGGFVTIPAAEVWLRAGGANLGHKTVLMFGDDTTLAGLTETDLQPMGTTTMEVGTCGVIATWATNLQATYGNLLLVPHHPAATWPMPTDWDCHDDAFEPMVEVYSEHGNSLGDGTGYDEMWSGEVAASTVHEAIDPDGGALRMGFSAGTDKHNSRPGDVCNLDTEMPSHPFGGGLTIVVADESESFTRDTIYDAMVAHHTLASTGPMVPVTIEFSTGGAELGGLGDDLGLPADQKLDVAVAVPSELAGYVTGVELVTPAGRFGMDDFGGGEYSTALSADDAAGFVYAAVEIDGALWYGSAGCDDGGDDVEYVWTSPSYVDTASGDLDADGVTYPDGDCDDGDASVYPGATEVAGDGIDQDCDDADLAAEAEEAAATTVETETEATEPSATEETAETTETTDSEAAAEAVCETTEVVTEDAATEAVCDTTGSADDAAMDAEAATADPAIEADAAAAAAYAAEMDAEAATADPATCDSTTETAPAAEAAATSHRPWRDGIHGHHSAYSHHHRRRP